MDSIIEIENIKIAKEIRYLGVTLTSKRNMFTKYKEEILMKAKKLENMTYGIIEKCCGRLLIIQTSNSLSRPLNFNCPKFFQVTII